MLDQIVGQLLQSGTGAELMKTVQAQGLSAEQATAALSATAEGALEHSGGIAGLLGGGGGGGGGLASMAAGLLGGNNAAPAGGSSLAHLAPTIASFVAQKTGLAPAMAQTIVSLALPKIEELIKGGAAGSKSGGGMLGGLLG